LNRSVYLIIAESAIETIPNEIKNHPAIMNDARRRKLPPEVLLLDRSFHHAAMLRLLDQEKRGRPDIVYHILLDVTNTPIFKSGALKLVFHTYNNLVIWVKEGLRPPRSYYRYENLMVQLFSKGSVENRLLAIDKLDFGNLIKQIKPDRIIGFSRVAPYKSLREVVADSDKYDSCSFVVGGFPKGHFNATTLASIDDLYSIDEFPMDASLVVNRLVYELENQQRVAI